MEKIIKKIFGLNINNSALAAVELAQDKNGLKAINFARVELERGVVEDNCIVSDPDSFKEALKKLLEEGNSGPFKSDHVIISIPEEKTFTHDLVVPQEYAHNHQYILSVAKDYIPINLNEAIVDYRITETDSVKKEVKIDFVAVQKSIIKPLVDLIGEVGLNVVAVDIGKNSLIRACDNPFQKNEGDILMVNIDEERALLSIKTASGKIYNLNPNLSGKQILNLIEDALKVKADSDLLSLLRGQKKDSDTSEAKKESIKNALHKPLETLSRKVEELKKVVENQGSLKVNSIYLMGSFSKIPGLKEVFLRAFPETNLHENLSYIHLDENTELYYQKAIGLALRSLLPDEGGDEINLLPHYKKEELYVAKITPSLMRGLVGAAATLSAVILITGIISTKTYLDYRKTANEMDISNEVIQNPYLNQVAKATQEKSLLESQMIEIMKDALPVSRIMRKLDNLNKEGMEILSVDYVLSKNSGIDMNLRAKAFSRTKTEHFARTLKEDPYFEEVNSPLSNLVGKGERFINLDLKVSGENVIRDKKYEEGEGKNTDGISFGSTNSEGVYRKMPQIPPSLENDEEDAVETEEEVISDESTAEEEVFEDSIEKIEPVPEPEPEFEPETNPEQPEPEPKPEAIAEEDLSFWGRAFLKLN